jgi:adenosine deaminase
MMQQLAEQGIVHAEVYISVGVIYMWRNFDPRCFEPIFAALERARERAAIELGLSLYWIFDAVRHFTVEEADRVFRKAVEMRAHYPSIVAIGLGGDERRAASEPFRTSMPRRQSRPAPHQSRRRNHRPRSHLGSPYWFRAHRPRPISHSGSGSDSKT